MRTTYVGATCAGSGERMTETVGWVDLSDPFDSGDGGIWPWCRVLRNESEPHRDGNSLGATLHTQ